MKSNELRLGNYIGHPLASKPLMVVKITIDEIGASTFLCPIQDREYLAMKDWEPIPLTPEWLERFDFYKHEKDKVYGNGFDWQPKDVFTVTTEYVFRPYDDIKYRFQNWHYRGGVDNQDKFVYGHDELVRCGYVHELQNLFFALTGGELEIENPSRE